ncbi:hypothetical protein BDZ89DRAFT_980572 [Hymenopellis radicata]|nr:hypothetical protein BDZ89DRAFT_980572 [Hymenopellis radicata]
MQMSFENATMWPAELSAVFAAARKGFPFESNRFESSRYYAPYNKLLSWMFPSWDFLVLPHAVTGTDAGDSVDYIALLVISRGKPVMLLEVKDDSYNAHPHDRRRADGQMRRLFNDMLERCPLPILYGISALGTSLCVYKGNTATFEMEPPEDLLLRKFDMSPPHYMENQWSVELLSQEGFKEVKRTMPQVLPTKPMIPFENATMWPVELCAVFAAEREGSQHESRYYALYNKLLNWMFPSWDFVVVPHAVPDFVPGTKTRNTLDFIALLVVGKGKPVMLLVVKDDSYIAKGSTRGRADIQMRHLFNDMLSEIKVLGCPPPTLYGISALGTTLRMYQGNTATFKVQPLADPSLSRIVLPPHYLENQWSVELLSQEGFDEMKKVAANIFSAMA